MSTILKVFGYVKFVFGFLNYMKYVTAFFLYVVFSLAGVIGGITAIVGGVLYRSSSYVSNVIRSLDTLLAAMIGYSGRKTISNECGDELKAGKPCLFCRWLCGFLSFTIFGYPIFEVEHCQKNAST